MKKQTDYPKKEANFNRYSKLHHPETRNLAVSSGPKRETLGTDGVPSTDSRFPGDNRTGRLSMALGTQKKKKKNFHYMDPNKIRGWFCYLTFSLLLFELICTDLYFLKK